MESSRTQMGPFAIVPRWLSRSSVSDGALRLYVALADRADRDTDVARFSRAQLAEDMGGVNEKTVSRRVAELESLGAIAVTRSKGEHGNEVNEYLVVQVRPKTLPPRDTGGGRDTDVPHLGTELSPTQGQECPAKKNHLEEPSTTTPTEPQSSSDECDPIALGIAQLLAGHIEDAGLWKWKRAMPVAAWAVDIEKLIRLDEVDPADLMDFVDWLYTDDGSATARFWRTQVLSGANLRKHRPMIENRREWEAGEAERRRQRQAEMDARFGTKPHVTPEQSQHPANKVKGRLPAWFWEQTFETLADLELEASNYGLTLDEALRLGGKQRSDFAA